MAEPPDEQDQSGPSTKRALAWLMSQNYIDSQTLFGDQQEVLIRHKNVMYRLQITKLGKLILTK